MLNEYILKDSSGQFKCSICNKSSVHKNNMRKHVERHFPNSFTYYCDYCEKEFNSKNSYSVHMSTKHREEKFSA